MDLRYFCEVIRNPIVGNYIVHEFGLDTSLLSLFGHLLLRNLSTSMNSTSHFDSSNGALLSYRKQGEQVIYREYKV